MARRGGYAAVGTDGGVDLVWGVGATPALAIADAESWLGGHCDTDAFEIREFTGSLVGGGTEWAIGGAK